MFAVTKLLALACAWAAAVAVPALGGGCTPIQIGQLIGEPIRLPDIVLTEQIRDWHVQLPDVPECPHGFIGVKALVCDYDAPPVAYFEYLNIILVHRVGDLLYKGHIILTAYCLSPPLNNQPLLQNNQLHLSNNLPWQNQNVAPLYGQSPLPLSSSLPSLDLPSQSSLGQLPNNLWSLPKSHWGQSPLASLSAVPLPRGQSSLGLRPRSLLDLSHNQLLGHSQPSALPSLSPLSLLDQSHNHLLGHEQLSRRSSPQLLGQASHQLLGQSPLLLGPPSHQLLGQTPLHLGQSSHQLLGQTPLHLGQASHQLLGQSPLLLG